MHAMHSAKTILFFLFIIISLLLLFHKTKNEEIIQGLEIPGKIINEPDSARKMRETNELVASISRLNQVKGSIIGFEGRKSTQPNYVHMLATSVDTSILVNLTNHKSAIVKLFSFEALLEKNYSHVKEIFEIHIFDQQTYHYIGGCIGEDIPINISFFRTLFPYLPKAQASFYRNKILKQNKSLHNIFELNGL